jgi:hypothetical protein
MIAACVGISIDRNKREQEFKSVQYCQCVGAVIVRGVADDPQHGLVPYHDSR